MSIVYTKSSQNNCAVIFQPYFDEFIKPVCTYVLALTPSLTDSHWLPHSLNLIDSLIPFTFTDPFILWLSHWLLHQWHWHSLTPSFTDFLIDSLIRWHWHSLTPLFTPSHHWLLDSMILLLTSSYRDIGTHWLPLSLWLSYSRTFTHWLQYWLVLFFPLFCLLNLTHLLIISLTYWFYHVLILSNLFSPIDSIIHCN